MKFKNRDIIQANDKDNQPEGRERATIIAFDTVFGVYTLVYKDGTVDQISQGLIDKHWDFLPHTKTRLWKLLTRR